MLVFALVSFGQPRSLRFDNYNSTDGLSENSVFAIHKDSRGFMWFGTDDGLNRFDGNSFTVYKPNKQGTRHIPGNRVRCISETADQKLLIGFEYEGLCVLDVNNDAIARFDLPRELGSKLRSFSVYDIEKVSDSVFWIATDYGVQLFSPSVGFWGRYNKGLPAMGGLSSNSVRSIHLASSGFVWIAYQNGYVDKFDPVKKRAYSYKIGTDANLSLGEDRYGNIWVGTSGGGVVRIAPGGAMSRHTSDSTAVGTLSDGVVPAHCIVADDLGRMWIGTGRSGLNELSQQNGDENTYFFIKHRADNAGNLSIADDAILSLFFDNSGILWVGHRGGGVSKVSLYPKRFANLALTQQHKLSRNAQAICAMPNGQLWAGTQTNGIVIFDNSANKTISTYAGDGPHPLPSNDVTAISLDSSGNIWIGTNGGGLVCIEKGRTIPVSLLHVAPASGGLAATSVIAVRADAMQNIWVASPSKLFVRLHSTGIFKELPVPALRGDIILNICPDKQGYLWLCTRRSGAIYFKPQQFLENIEFVQIPPSSDGKTGLSHPTVYDIAQANNGKIWIATGGGGITIWDRTKGQADVINERNGLPTGIIRSIVEDKNGKMWMSTHRGIVSVAGKRVQVFNQEDGLMSENFIAGAEATDATGTIFFGSDRGVVSFRPDQITLSYEVPQVILNELRIFNTPVALLHDAESRKELLGPLQSKKEIQLSYLDYVFSIEFSAIDLNTPGKCKYQYRLVGFDNQWIQTDANNRIATYTNLRDGEYTFMVKASNGDGVWSKTPTSIRIRITPPYWETAWFRCMILITIFAGGFYMFNKYRTRNETQKQDLEELIAVRTRELEMQKKDLETIAAELRITNATKDRFFSIIAHDLKSPFNAFIGFTTMLRNNFAEYDDNKKMYIIDIVSQSAISMNELLTNLLNWARTQSKAVEYLPSPINLHAEAASVMHLLSSPASAKNISLHNTIDDGTLAFADPNQLSAILRNLISNSIKFTADRGTITVSACSQSGYTTVSVSDTGVGMSQEQVNNLFKIDGCYSTHGTNKERGTGLGLVVVKEFVEINHGSISISSICGAGTTVSISLPTYRNAEA